jgi:hypothetical protein
VLTAFALAGGAATAAAPPSDAAAPPAWNTATKSVTRTPMPTPVVTGIRVGRHATFDRLVVDLRGNAPGYRVGYVRTLREDGSGRVVDLRGPASLQITLTPADAHNPDTGAPTLRTPSRKRWFYPEVKEYAVIGDFEAVVTVGVGLAHKRPFRVFTLSNPTRIVVDVAH